MRCLSWLWPRIPSRSDGIRKRPHPAECAHRICAQLRRCRGAREQSATGHKGRERELARKRELAPKRRVRSTPTSRARLDAVARRRDMRCPSSAVPRALEAGFARKLTESLSRQKNMPSPPVRADRGDEGSRNVKLGTRLLGLSPT